MKARSLKMSSSVELFSWSFLDEVGRWSLGIVALAALVGAVVTRSWEFPTSCLLAGTIDFALVHFSAVRGGRSAERGEIDQGAMALFLGGRLGYKVLLLSAAFVWPRVLDFWGVVVGALSYDMTLLVVGSILAVNRTHMIGR
jgi:hypothetical protein